MDNSSGELSLTTRSSLLSFYNLPTTTSTGNPITMIVSGTGRPSIYRNTSVRASKVDITDVGVDPAKVLDLPVRDWYDRTQWQRKQDACIQAENFGGLETLPFEDQVRATCELPRIPGLVAEEVEEAGLSEFCTYDENGDLAGVMYDRVPLLLIPLVRDLREQLAEMADRLNRLEGDHSE